MSSEVKVPAVGESISSGILSVWHKEDGSLVETGDVLFTLETDKVSQEVNATESGLLQIQVPEGEEVKIGDTVATIDPSKAGTSKTDDPKGSESGEESPKPSPGQKADDAPTTDSKSPDEQSTTKPSGTPPPSSNDAGVSSKSGSQSSASSTTGSDTERQTRKKLSPLRRKIATQLVMAQRTAAILSTFNECDMSSILQLRKEMQEEFLKKHGVKLGFMSFFLKAAVDALKLVPSLNARMDGEELVINHYFDIGVAVGTDRGLVVPVVRDCDQKSFAEIEQDLGGFAGRARQGKIGIEELQGGVFSISNGGVYGSLLSTPILNPPQSGILGMHKIQERPVVVDGKIVIRPMMYLALSYDHRVVDGKEAVTFLVRVKDCIENPARLLLGV